MVDTPKILNRVLIKRPGFYRTFRHPNGSTESRLDADSISYLFGEAIALSAVQLAMAPTSPARHYLAQLPTTVRSRITVIDQAGEAQREVAAFLRPVGEELGMADGPDGGFAFPPSLPIQAREAFTPLIPGLYDLLLAGRAHLQVDLDLPRLIQAVASLRTVVRGAEARARLDVFAGVLNAYKPLEVPSLSYVSGVTSDQEKYFRSLVEDLAYRELSEQTAKLGIPADFTRLLRLIGRGVDAVMTRTKLAEALRSGSQALLAAHGVALPDVDLKKLVSPTGFYPPIVSLSGAYQRAEQAWKAQCRPAREIEQFQDLTDGGYVELEQHPQLTMDDVQGQAHESLRTYDPRRSR